MSGAYDFLAWGGAIMRILLPEIVCQEHGHMFVSLFCLQCRG
jgi:hypothetical protein